MKRIKQRLLSLAMTCALLLGSSLPEALASGSKNAAKVQESAKAAQKAEQKASDKAQSEEKDADTQKETKASKSSKSESKDSEKAGNTVKKTDESKKAVTLTLSVSKPSDLASTGGVYQVDPDTVSALTLSWKCKGDCDSFEVSVSGDVYSASTRKKSAKIPISGLSEGKYTATLKAISGGKTVAKVKLSFVILPSAAAEDAQAGEDSSVADKDAEEAATRQAESKATDAEAKNADDLPQAAEEAQVQPDEEQPDTSDEQSVEAPQDIPREQPAEEQQDFAEEQSVEEQQVFEEELPVEEQQVSEEELPVEEQQDVPREQPVEEQPVVPREQPVEEQPVVPQEQPVEEQPDVPQEQPVEEQPVVPQEQPVEEQPDVPPEQPVEEQPDSAEEHPAEEQQGIPGEQPVEDQQDIPEAQPVEEAQALSEAKAPDIPEGQPVGEALDAVEALPAEEPMPEQEILFQFEDQIAVAQDALEAAASVGIVEAPDDLDIEAAEPDGELVLEDQEADAEEARGEPIASNEGKKDEKSGAALTLSILGMDGLTVIDGTVHVDPARADAVTLSWSFGGECDEYAVGVSGGSYEATTKKTQLKLPVEDLPAGKYTVTVSATKDSKKLSSARLSFVIEAPESAGETSKLVVTVASPQGLLITDGVYQADPRQADALTLAWQFGGECEGYNVTVSGDVYSGTTEENTLTVPLADLKAGTYTVTVMAISGADTLAQARLAFEIPEEQKGSEDQQGKGEKQGGAPKGGARMRGSMGGAKGGDAGEAEQGFHITPGEALVSTHTSGNRDMRLYGAVALTLDGEGPMNQLILGGTVLDIRLSDNGMFTASIEEDALALTPEGEAQAWLLNGFALKTLARSGIATLRLTLDGATVDYPTQPELTGRNYGALCAAGWASRDYSYNVTADGCSVTVAGQTFQLTAEGELA